MPFDPNLAYFLLVIGLWLAATAAYVPGTGVIEVVALVALVIALWLLALLPTNLAGLLLLSMGVVGFALIPFIRRRPLWLLAVGIALQLVGSLTLFHHGVMVSSLLMVVTLTLPLAYHTLLLMPMVDKHWKNTSPTMERDAQLIGMSGRVVEDLNPLGMVYVNGETWSAEGRRKLKRGTPIIVIAREGLRLIVDIDKQKRDQLALMDDADDEDSEESLA